MDPTAKGYRERILAGAKKYGERAMALAKQAIHIMKVVTKIFMKVKCEKRHVTINY